MTDDERTIEILKLITAAEHHFNNLCFNIRALASTWLLATFAGIGWILKDLSENAKGSGLVIDKVDLMLALCIGSSVGIFVLWILDIRVYQQMLNVWFENRKTYEVGDAFPSVRVGMKNLFKTGRATGLIMIYYLALISAPLLLSLFIAHSVGKSGSMYIVGFILLLINFAIYASSPRDEKWIKERMKEKDPD